MTAEHSTVTTLSEEINGWWGTNGVLETVGAGTVEPLFQ